MADPIVRETEVEAVIDQPLNPKKLEIVPNWRSVFYTYSFWLYVCAALLTLVEQVLPILGFLEPTMSTATYGILVFSLNLLGIVLRFIKQSKLWPKETQSEISTE